MNNVSQIIHKISWYSSELLFIVKNVSGWRSKLLMIRLVILYHINNYLKNSHSFKSYQIEIIINNGYSRTFTIRPYTGDIFVLFEILMHKAYLISEKLLPAQSVKCILDCGANIGVTSLFFAERYRQATIYSIEPVPETYEILKRNVATEPRIVPVQAAIVGHPRPSVTMTSDESSLLNHITDDGKGHEVTALTVEQICEKYGIRQIDLLKVDIEGAESELFSNGKFLEKTNFIIIELHGAYDIENFRTDLSEFDFGVRPENDLDNLKLVTARSARLASHRCVVKD